MTKPNKHHLFLILIVAVVAIYAWYVRGIGAPSKPADPRLGVWTASAEPREWSLCASVSEAARARSSVSAFGLWYVMDQGSSAVRALDPVTCTWTDIPSLPTVRTGGALVQALGHVYAVGGTGPAGPAAEVYRYDPATNAWSRVADLPHPRGPVTSATLDGKIYVIGGGAVEIYDPEKDAWTVGPTLPTSNDAAAAQLNRTLFVFDGKSVFGISSALPLWKRYNPMPEVVHGVKAVLVGDTLYILGDGAIYALTFPPAL